MAIKSKEDKGKATFTLKDKLMLHTLLFGADRKSLDWLNTEVQREIKKRDRKMHRVSPNKVVCEVTGNE